MTVFIEYFEKGCEKHQTLNASGKLRSMGATGKSDEALLGSKEKLDRALDAEKGVPGIAYCSGVLLSNKFSSYDGIRIKGANTYCASGDDHVSIVVNRRPGKNGCEYLIRNTYGVSCNSYSWPCKNGQVWIPEKELLKNLKGVLWVE